jgi:hypothetical protein
MFIQEHNCETGEITYRELTAAEIKQREDEAAKAQAEREAKAKAKADLLAKLGITEEEAKLLLG